jgi:hypothetical protein
LIDKQNYYHLFLFYHMHGVRLFALRFNMQLFLLHVELTY